MRDFLLYGHGGCENHGCEAIVRGTAAILKREFPEQKFVLSKQASDMGIDAQISLPVDRIILQNKLHKFSPQFLLAGMYYVLFRSKKYYYRFLYKDLREYVAEKRIQISFSIGGDNYCYGMHDSLYYLDGLMQDVCKRVLWGCSIEPKTLTDGALIKDLDSFDLIVAREPITAQALQKVLKSAKVVMKPDPAFALKASEVDLPANLQNRKIVGLNVSPMVKNMINGVDMTFLNYAKTVEYILGNTEYGILLVPHVTWAKSNDLEPLKALFEKYKHTGRVALVEKFESCEDLKGYIAQCDMFIGARTHSTIAAYSSCVPCVVVGYSVKADGIATQLFGTTENYVVDSKALRDENTLVDTFRWLESNHQQIKAHLEEIMPQYIEEAYSAAKCIWDYI